jgi:AcrR family transcriptional regulator
MTLPPSPERPYHHGNLRTALIEASFALIAEHGLGAFSVAKAARAVGVSTASPYRHFADRDHLLAAVAAQAALELADRMRADADAAGADHRERLAVTAGTYVRYVDERGIGLDVIFSTPLTRLEDPELAAAGRALTSLLLELSEAAGTPGSAAALQLLERHLVTAHGYITLQREGFFSSRRPKDTVATIAERAIAASRDLLARGEG